MQKDDDIRGRMQEAHVFLVHMIFPNNLSGLYTSIGKEVQVSRIPPHDHTEDLDWNAVCTYFVYEWFLVMSAVKQSNSFLSMEAGLQYFLLDSNILS